GAWQRAAEEFQRPIRKQSVMSAPDQAQRRPDRVDFAHEVRLRQGIEDSLAGRGGHRADPRQRSAGRNVLRPFSLARDTAFSTAARTCSESAEMNSSEVRISFSRIRSRT